MAPFTKPETFLREAESLVSVGRKSDALQSLTEMFASRKFRQTPLAALEPIMLYFIELCVELRKGRIAKEGLMQYKNISQNTSVGSIENVIRHFVSLADAKVTEAQEKAEKAIAVDVDDLEAIETPESMLMGAVSGDQSKDRTDRALVTPWLKFLWESYRTALETLKNNARLETFYQQIAQQAFKFCLKHDRKIEFRRLCETLRLHLSNVAKYAHQPHAINLSDTDTLQHHLDTRFAQLNASAELELWQEAFRSVEDIHNLLTMAKKAPRPAMMANYYEKLTRIFLTSGNALFHAASWARYYSVLRVLGGNSDEELSRLAGQVLVGALAVPVSQESTDEEVGRGRLTRLMVLLGLTKMPTRTGLLKEALSRNVLKVSPRVVKDLYEILEVTFDPLTLCESVAPLLKELSEDPIYASYLPLLQRALLSRLLSQLSQVYTSMNLDQLLGLVQPLQGSFEGAYTPAQFEAFLMGCARRGDVRIRIDHASRSLTFVDEAFGCAAAGPSQLSPTSVDKTIQPSASELVRSRLSSIASCLHTALNVIEPPQKSAAELSKEKFAALVEAADAERKALQVRRAIVARRQILLKELSARKETEEASRRAEANRRDREEQARRQFEETRRREQERVRKEVENIKKEEARQLAQTLKEKKILKVDVEDMEDLDTDNLMRLQVQQFEKEKKEQAERTRIIAKRHDHIERAMRKEERPLLASDYERQQREDREGHAAAQVARVEAARSAHTQAVQTKHRLARIIDDYRERRESYISRRGEEFTRRREEAKRKIEEEKEKRRKAVLRAREEERRRREEEERVAREKEEEERRLAEERIEEERRLAKEKEDAEKAAEEQRLAEEARKQEQRKQRDIERAAAAEEARRKMQREEEAEARRQQRRAEERAPTTRAAEPSTGGAAAWRRPAHPTAASPSPTPSPAPIAAAAAATPVADGAPGKYRPGAFRGGAPAGGGWRERQAAKAAEGDAAPRRPESPATSPAPVAEGGWRAREAAARRTESPATPPAVNGNQTKDDGFQTVPSKAPWRPSRGRGARP